MASQWIHGRETMLAKQPSCYILTKAYRLYSKLTISVAKQKYIDYIEKWPQTVIILLIIFLMYRWYRKDHKSRVERKTIVTQTYFWNPCLGATWTPL